MTVIQGGRQIATFAESHPTLGNPELLDDLAAGGVGTIRVLVDPGWGRPRNAEPRAGAAPIVEAQRPPTLCSLSSHRPVIGQSDDPNATLSALFGPHRDASDQPEPIGFDGHGQQSSIQVESVLPQLKLLVRNRLQRSSGSVEEVVDSAAHDRHSVEWLSDRVRVMTMRGFLHFDIRPTRGRHACAGGSRTGLRRLSVYFGVSMMVSAGRARQPGNTEL